MPINSPPAVATESNNALTWTAVSVSNANTNAVAGTNSTTISDSGTKTANVTATVAGTGVVSTAQAKFGTSSFAINGGGNGFTITDNANLEFGNSDFTIDLWLRAASPSGYLIGKGNAASAAGSAISWLLGTNISFYSSGLTATMTTGSPSANAWNHLAVCRRGQKFMYYVNGVLWSTTLVGADYPINNVSDNWHIGYYAGLGGITGHIDELRIVNGVCLFPTEFDPYNFIYSY